MKSISVDLFGRIVELNQKILSREITNPGELALALKEIVVVALEEDKQLQVAWLEIPPSIRIDP